MKSVKSVLLAIENKKTRTNTWLKLTASRLQPDKPSLQTQTSVTRPDVTFHLRLDQSQIVTQTLHEEEKPSWDFRRTAEIKRTDSNIFQQREKIWGGSLMTKLLSETSLNSYQDFTFIHWFFCNRRIICMFWWLNFRITIEKQKFSVFVICLCKMNSYKPLKYVITSCLYC